jgi:hypothetical protein
MKSAVLISRIFSVLAATMVVAAFSLIVLAPSSMSLVQGLAQLDPELPRRLQLGTEHALGKIVWVRIFLPLLVRPVWLVPTCLALLFGGLAASTGAPTQSPRSTRTRGS